LLFSNKNFWLKVCFYCFYKYTNNLSCLRIHIIIDLYNGCQYTNQTLIVVFVLIIPNIDITCLFNCIFLFVFHDMSYIIITLGCTIIIVSCVTCNMFILLPIYLPTTMYLRLYYLFNSHTCHSITCFRFIQQMLNIDYIIYSLILFILHSTYKSRMFNRNVRTLFDMLSTVHIGVGTGGIYSSFLQYPT